MHKALHPRDDIDYMCQEKKEEKDSSVFDVSIQRLEDCIKKRGGHTDYSDQKQYR